MESDYFSYGSIPLMTQDYDMTFGTSQGIMNVKQCIECGALVDQYAADKHIAFHDKIKELIISD